MRQRAVLETWVYVRLRGSASRVSCCAASVSRSLNVEPSLTANCRSRKLGVPRSGAYTSVSSPPPSVYQTLLASGRAVPKPSLFPAVQLATAPGAPGASAATAAGAAARLVATATRISPRHIPRGGYPGRAEPELRSSDETSRTALHRGDGAPEGAGGRGCLEHVRSGAGGRRLQRGLAVAQPPRVPRRPRRDRRLPAPQVGARARLRAAQGPVGVHRQPDRGALPVRVPRRVRAVVAQLRQRAVGVRRRGLHAPARGEHQRCRDRRVGPAHLRTASGERARGAATAGLATAATPR